MDQARFRPAQVAASTAAAVGGAYLASGLGVYGTIIGVGVITLISTVGGEMLLLSLERTKQAARTAGPRLRRTDIAHTENSGDDAGTTEQPATAELPGQEPEPDVQVPNARRWRIVAGASVASFVLALALIIGIETFTGESLDGEGGPTVLDVLRTGQDSDGPSAPVSPPTDAPTDAPENGETPPDGPDDATTPQPDPATSSQSSPPADLDDSPQRDETPAPDEEVTPSPDQEETPPEEETTPPPDEEQPAPADDDPTPEP